MQGSQCSQVRKSPPSEARRCSWGLFPLKQQLGWWDTWASSVAPTPETLTHTHTHTHTHTNVWEPEGCYVSLHFILRAPDCTQGPRDPWVCAPGGGGAAFPGEGCSSQAWAGVEMKQGWLFERVHDGSSLCGRVLDYISSVTLKCDVLPIHWLLQIAGLCSSSVLKKRLLYCFGFAVIISVQNKIKSQACYSWRIKYIIIICIITMLYIRPSDLIHLLFLKLIILEYSCFEGLPRWLSGKESTCQCGKLGFDPWVRKIPWRRKWQLTPVLLPGKSHGQRSLG